MDFTGAAGDEVEVFAVTTTQFRLRPKLASGAAVVAVSGRMIQSATTTLSTFASGTTLIPVDDTIPQNTEGDEYLSVSITPTNAASRLEISVILNISSSVISNLIAALFKDSVASALAATMENADTAGSVRVLTLLHTLTAGTTSPITFKVRAGGQIAGTTRINGGGSGRFFGSVFNSFITVKEISV